MKHERKFRESERDYEETRKKDKKNKGHRGDRGEGELWASMFDSDDLGYDAPPTRRPAMPSAASERRPQQDAPTGPSTGPAFQFNEAATIEVKGYRIDLSRVKEVTKEQTIHNGKNSFGIKFLFVGAKGLSRTIWYGTNFRQRDEEFETYLASWEKANPAKR